MYASINSTAALAATVTAPFEARASRVVDPLERESKEIERRRARLEDRRKRVLHAKTRLIGVDVEALDAQVLAKQRLQLETQAEQNQHQSLMMNHVAQITDLVSRKAEADAYSKQALAFHHQQQAAEKSARDLTRKQEDKTAPQPAERFLVFAGEDLNAKTREAAQKRQQREWATQQIEIKEMAECKERMEETAYEKRQQEILQLQRADEERRAFNALQYDAHTAAANAQLAATKRTASRQQRAIDQQLSQSELDATYNSSFLREQTERDGNRGYCFKGFPVEVKQSILDTQRAQQLELAQRRQAKIAADHDYDSEQDAYRRELILNDIASRERAQLERTQLAGERERQARAKTSRDQYLNGVVYTNRVDDSFFNRFGSSAR